VYGVSFLLVGANLAVAEALHRLTSAAGVVRAARVLPVAFVAIVTCWLLGTRSIVANDARTDAAPSRPVAVVQTNIAPALRWTRAYVNAQIAAHLRESDRIPESAAPALIVWPESAIPRYLESEPTLERLIGGIARRHHADLLFGVPRYEDGRSFNSVRLIRSDGRLGGYYDKQRLVPLAEEKPTIFSRGTQSADEPESFVPGTGSAVLPGFVPLGVSVCHEIIHPDLVDAAAGRGAELLVNVANDGWVGQLSVGAAEQHLTMAVFRAIETRRFLVRAAITGVSAVIDPYGRITSALPAGEAGVLVTPVRPETRITWYVRLGDVFAVACAGFGLFACLILTWRSPVRLEAPAAVLGNSGSLALR
jgi:apolipoprotein N-acyltransferase